MAKVHEHEDSREAYGACQTDDDHEDGDVLVIESEQVVGIVGTWPCAITVKRGKLEQAKQNWRTDDLMINNVYDFGRDARRAEMHEQNIREGYRLAKQIARERGWPLRPEDE